MNGRIWIIAMAMVWLLGCEGESEGPTVVSSEPPMTRSCCDRNLADCVPEPEKACTEEDGRPVISWE